ncbi:MAG: YXWGXW repeat-containing protein [Steroidobacteraceae bacterium]
MTRSKRSLSVLAAVALTLGALTGVHPSTAQAAIGIDIDVAPPAPRVIVAPPPRAGFVWAPGYWRWNGHSHVWRDGYWVRERRGYHWVPDNWASNGGHYHYARGHWER